MWKTIFLINWIVNILVIEFLAIRKLQTVSDVQEDRDSKFPAFRRLDTFWFSRWWLYPTCHFMVGKLLFVYFWMYMTAVMCKVLTYGIKETDTVTGLRYVLMRIN